MQKQDALAAFSALGQEIRLDAVRLLVRAGPEGIAAGTLASHLGISHNLMSNHLSILVSSGLAASEKQGRSMIYRAQFEALRGLLGFLMSDCCIGLPEIVDGIEAEAAAS